MAAEEPRVKIVLGQAVLKAKRMEIVLQKSTELGISEFLPVVTERTIVKIQEKERRRQERWQRIAREAAKQSRRAVFPTVCQPSTLAEVLTIRNEERMLFLSQHQGAFLKDILLFNGPQNEDKTPASVIILVGPEGGWTDPEEKTMLSHDYEAVSLGQAVLRAETAAISAVAMLSHFWLC
jgi:16S rRNA (uracil1498-N3)-methyltransferase